MSVNTSPNMLLPVPSVGTEASPQWAIDINACMALIDQHDHSSGEGVQVTPAGININGDLTFKTNNAISLKSVRFTSQSSPLSGASDIGCIYESGVDLYYNDGSGNQVRITQSGGVAGTPGSISNLVSPASAAYSSGSTSFIWESAANTAANMDAGSYVFRNSTANSKGLTLSPPNSMASDYTVTLPALPASQKFMTLDASGNMAAQWAVDNSTIEVNSNTVRVKDAGITNAKLAALTYTLSSSCGAFSTSSTTPVDVTNLTATITTVGRPVMVMLISDGTSNRSNIDSNTSGSLDYVIIDVYRDATAIVKTTVGVNANTGGNVQPFTPVSVIQTVDFPGAGTYVYKVQMANALGFSTVQMNYAKLLVYEIS